MIFLNMVEWGEVNKLPSLFNNITIPDKLDKKILIDKIVYDNWDLHPRVTDYNLFKKMIENFFELKKDTYTKIIEVLESDYNPIHNYDRYEDKNETRKNDVSDTNKRNNSINSTNSTKENHNENSNENNNSEHKTSAFNTSDYQSSSLDIDTNVNSVSSDRTITNTDTKNENETNDRDITTNDSYTTDNHLYGNIGVTTTQQMIESEIKLREDNNIYELIAIDFRREFMLLCL